MTMIALPKRGRGRPSAKAQAIYDGKVEEFCQHLLEIQSGLDFKPGARGWCYILEEYGLLKGGFDTAEKLINACRKSGHLPIDFTLEDSKREIDNVEVIDDTSADEEAESILDYISHAHLNYFPISFWDDKPVFIQMLVEKIDLKSLFAPVVRDFRIPIANSGGWSDLHVRAKMMRRFAHWEARGKQCVLLYCGDFDPGGLQISGFLRKNFADLADAVGWHPGNLIIDRFGLNYDFIQEHNLTWIDNLETGSGQRLDDQNHPDHDKAYVQDYIRKYRARKVEANALVVRPDAGRELCRQAILKYIDGDLVAAYEERLASVQEEVRQEVVQLIAEGYLT
jgi:hypothetical protein